MADAVRRHEPDCLIYRPHRLEGQAPIFCFYEQYRSAPPSTSTRPRRTWPPTAREVRALVRQPTEVELYRSLTD